MVKTSQKLLVRRHYWRDPNKHGRLHSTNVPYSTHKSYRSIKKLLPELASYVWKECSEDDLKAAANNKPKPALTSKPAFNIYLGRDLPKEEHERDKQGVKRAAYGLGSGANSIGLDPETMKLYPMNALAMKLMEKITPIIKGADPTWNESLEQTPFNFLGVKLYFNERMENGAMVKKTCEWHVDVTHDKEGKPMRNNSQVPGTPVAILTYGTTKNLWFRRHQSNDVFYNSSKIHFQQRSGSLTVVDARDEVPDEQGFHWRHKSDMVGEDPNGIAFSFSFRCVQMHQFVDPKTNRLVYPWETPMKTAWFRAKKYKRLMKTREYKATAKKIHKRVNAFLGN
jgi:hypothetical protein